MDDIVRAIIIAILGLGIDFIFCEPPQVIHPVVWIGRVIESIDNKIPRGNEKIERGLGAMLLIIPI
ncbi:MAG: cobalamin biosynthesis protein, partial [Candidatus Methanospirareceae archaeon]